ncbi:MAG: O-sialoglycoprotein endopeptidase [Firmicutes bacterium]|nr:O-sialoglycoprotein endopeptidase [Bacillota bacterium]
MFFLGIDTSNYVTSMAIVETGADGDHNLLWEQRIGLKVPKGNRGLRQSEAVFQHLKNMPLLWEEALSNLPGHKLCGIAASVKPRNIEDSYMPVFQIGKSFGQSAAFLLDVPFYGCSHQDGHIAAGIWSAKCFAEKFLALHLSGGTTEILQVVFSKGKLDIELLGGTTDLNAGQFVDRIGVKLGFFFPAGKELEKLAAQSKKGGLIVPVSVKGYHTSFSGPTTFIERALDKGAAPEEAARGVETCIAQSFLKVTRKAFEEKKIQNVLVTGGVAANTYIKKYLAEGLPFLNFFFPEPSFVGDNAVGAALLGTWEAI